MEHPPSPPSPDTPPAPDTRPERLALLRERLRLKEQWNSQVRILRENGFLSIIPETHDFGYKDAEGKIHPIPLEKDIAKMLENPEQQEFLLKKQEQGFTRLLLVPAKFPLDRGIKNFGETIARHRKEGMLLLSDGTKVTEPPYEGKEVYVWDEYTSADTNGKLVYVPREFSRTHGGLSKSALPGWRILLTEDLPNLKREGQGATKGGRKQLETDKTPHEYLTLLATDPQYKGEQGYDPETYLIDATTRLDETNTVTDDDTYSYLIRGWFPSAGAVPGACFFRGSRRARLSGGAPGSRGGSGGVRVSVGVSRP